MIRRTFLQSVLASLAGLCGVRRVGAKATFKVVQPPPLAMRFSHDGFLIDEHLAIILSDDGSVADYRFTYDFLPTSEKNRLARKLADRFGVKWVDIT